MCTPECIWFLRKCELVRWCGAYFLEFLCVPQVTEQVQRQTYPKDTDAHSSEVTIGWNGCLSLLSNLRQHVITSEFLEPYSKGLCSHHYNCLGCLTDTLCSWCQVCVCFSLCVCFFFQQYNCHVWLVGGGGRGGGECVCVCVFSAIQLSGLLKLQLVSGVCVCVCECVRACMHACACVRMCMCVCVQQYNCLDCVCLLACVHGCVVDVCAQYNCFCFH